MSDTARQQSQGELTVRYLASIEYTDGQGPNQLEPRRDEVVAWLEEHDAEQRAIEALLAEEQHPIETYVARARRLGLNPTKVCIACGAERPSQTLVNDWKFCNRHVDWERKAVIRCASCGHEVPLTCSAGLGDGS